MDARRITFTQLDYFLAVAKHLSFTKAAESLFVSQPTISKQIQVLEELVGAQLFARNRRSVKLTAAGEVLMREMSDVMQQIDNAVYMAGSAGRDTQMPVRIGVFEGIDANDFLNPFIEGFYRSHPEVVPVLEKRSFRELREKLVANRLDAIVTLLLQIEDEDGLVIDSLKRIDTSIVVPADDVLAQRSRLSISDLNDRDFVIIAREESSSGYETILRICSTHGYSPKTIKSLPNIESVLRAVAAGQGVTIVESGVKHKDIQNIKLVPTGVAFTEIVLARKRTNTNKALELFAESLLDAVAQ